MNSQSLFERIPEYGQILNDLSKGNLKANFSLTNRKSKLSYSLNDILFDENNDELSYFVLFMDSLNASNYVKFLLDLNNFELTLTGKNKLNKCQFCIGLSDVSNSIFMASNNCACFKSFTKNVAQDALSIYSKYISKDAKYSIDLPDELIKNTITNICPEREDAILDSSCFIASKDHVYKHILNNYYDKYLVSEYHCKYLLNILENQKLTLSDFLYDEMAVVFFLEYLEKEGVQDLLKFWMQAENFSRNLLLSKQNPSLSRNTNELDSVYKQWQNDAIIIYDNYISLQAISSLGFDTLVRCQVESNICQELDANTSANYDYLINSYSNCFYIPMLIVFNLMEKIYFKSFSNSQLYRNYMSEILASSEIKKREIGCKNNNAHSNRAITNSSNENDAELWTRPNVSNTMQLGKIDSTGRFVRNFKMKPDESNEMLNTLVDEDFDDPWRYDYTNARTVLKEASLNAIDNSNSIASVLVEKSKSKFEKLINNLRPISNLVMKTSSEKEEEERELAERVAAMIVGDVMRQNHMT